ncbi:hypothetical protein [Moraxella lacunata]|uniref:hypothetical protein n=1 Tax=Moraxella lacunata TaxID=477 RepID=UPI003EE2D697
MSETESRANFFIKIPFWVTRVDKMGLKVGLKQNENPPKMTGTKHGKIIISHAFLAWCGVCHDLAQAFGRPWIGCCVCVS